eukprot:2530406-Amphidinium_carterae.1
MRAKGYARTLIAKEVALELGAASYMPRVSHIAGVDNKIADVLSRMPQDETLQAPPLCTGAERHVPPPRPAE